MKHNAKFGSLWAAVALTWAMAAQGGNGPPSVRLVAPLEGDEYADPSEIVLRAEASDSDGTVTNVAFFSGTTKLGDAALAPYAYTWRHVAEGAYNLSARASDEGGGAATSLTVTVVVKEPSAPLPNPGRRDFYVAPDATAQGDGSYASPWQIQVALDHPAELHPGDTIWLRGGTYGTGVSWLASCRINGASNNPVRIRGFPGERAVIDGGILALSTYSSWVWWEDFEIMNSSTQRVVWAGNDPNPANQIVERQPGLNMAGRGMRAINLVVHDTGHPGIGNWEQVGDGGEVHGCLIWAVGYYDKDCYCSPPCGHPHDGLSGHPPSFPSGSGIYAQNRDGTRFFTDVISFRNVTIGIKPYASGGYCDGFHVEDCVMFECGDMNFFLTGHDNGAARDKVVNNVMWRRPTAGNAGVRFGYQGTQNDVSFWDNYVVNGQAEWGFFLRRFPVARVTGNTMVGGRCLAQWEPLNSVDLNWDRNAYYGGSDTPFTIAFADDNMPRYTFDGWKTETGNDLNSTYDAGRPTAARVYVRKNRYEPGRGNVTILNWASQPTVAVDLSPLLAAGEPYEVRDAQNFFGPPVTNDVYAGGAVDFPMNQTEVSQSTGVLSGISFTPTAPTFGVFVVTSRRPFVRVDATTPAFSENGQTGTFTVWRWRNTNEAITVNYTVSGTATPGTDYAALSGTVEIAAGARSARITITPTNDTAAEAAESVQVTLRPNGSAYYVDAQADTAQMTIMDDDGIGAGVIGHWPLDEGSGAAVTPDISGNGNHGTIDGGAWTGGHFNGGLALDGVRNSVELTRPSVANRNNYTISAWVRLAGGGSVYGEGKTLNSGPYMRFNVYGSSIGFAQRDNGNVSCIFSGGAALSDGAWHHVALVRAGSGDFKLYADGSLKASSVSPQIGATTVDTALIGVAYRSGKESYFGGTLDDVRIYDRALSATELSDIRQESNPFDGLAPGAPAELTLSAKTWRSVAFSWSAATDNVAVAGYRVYRDGAQIATTTGTNCLDSAPAAATTHAYTVRAYDDAGNVSPASLPLNVTTDAGPDTEAPGAPPSLRVTAVGTTSIALAWEPAPDNVGVVSYKVIRDGLVKGIVRTTNWTETGLLSRTTYSYRIRAYDAAGNFSTLSPSVSATTLSMAEVGMVNYWPMNEGAGTVVGDTVGSKNGTVYNGARWVAGAPGLQGHALEFSATNWVDLPGVTLGNLDDAYTLSAWFKVPANTSAGGVLYGEGHTVNNGPIVRLKADSTPTSIFLNFYHRGLTGGAGGGSATIAGNDGAWHMVAAVRESAGLFKLYFDGDLKNTTPVNPPPLGAGNLARIGCWQNVYYDAYMDGAVDDVRIYGRALSAGEIEELYEVGSTPMASTTTLAATTTTVAPTTTTLAPTTTTARPTTTTTTTAAATTTTTLSGGVPTAGLVGYWNFDEGTGTTAADSSGKGYNGTLGGVNAPVWTAPGKVGTSSLLFDIQNYRTPSRVDLPAGLDALATNSGFSISAWCKPNANPGSGYCRTTVLAIQAGNTDTGGNGLGYYYNAAGDYRFNMRFCHTAQGTAAVAMSPAHSPVGVWYHVAGVVDRTAGTVKLYTNGVLSATSTFAPGTAPYALWPACHWRLGAWGSYRDDVNFGRQTLDEVRMYNRALSANEVLLLADVAPPDAQAPSLTVLTPANLSYTTNDQVDVTGTAADDSGVASVTVNGAASSTSSGFTNWNGTVTGLAVGTNVVTVVATDTPGNAATNAVRVIYAAGAFDGNADGLPDLWQVGHFGCGFTTNADAGCEADPDSDGMCNREEWRAGTDPRDGADRFAVTAVQPGFGGGAPTLQWRSVSGHVYEVQWSSNLAGWTSFAPAVTAAAPSASAMDPDAGQVTNRFYRVTQP